jgi:hypothetical protein
VPDQLIGRAGSSQIIDQLLSPVASSVERLAMGKRLVLLMVGDVVRQNIQRAENEVVPVVSSAR